MNISNQHETNKIPHEKVLRYVIQDVMEADGDHPLSLYLHGMNICSITDLLALSGSEITLLKVRDNEDMLVTLPHFVDSSILILKDYNIHILLRDDVRVVELLYEKVMTVYLYD